MGIFDENECVVTGNDYFRDQFCFDKIEKIPCK